MRMRAGCFLRKSVRFALCASQGAAAWVVSRGWCRCRFSGILDTLESAEMSLARNFRQRGGLSAPAERIRDSVEQEFRTPLQIRRKIF